MIHIDEHILELYVLNADEAAPRREEIEAHLRECDGCRDLADRMSVFHANFAEELKKTPVRLRGIRKGQSNDFGDLCENIQSPLPQECWGWRLAYCFS
jgi:hypothetical protein